MKKANSDKCLECKKKKKVFRVVTPFGTLPVCSKCMSKVFEIKTQRKDDL